MIKILALLAALNATSTRTYHYKGSHILDTVNPTCGAGVRFVKERFDIKIKGDRAWVNNKEWELVWDDDDMGLVLGYRAQPDAYMSMSLLIKDGVGAVYMEGIDAITRKPCEDMVKLVKR